MHGSRSKIYVAVIYSEIASPLSDRLSFLQAFFSQLFKNKHEQQLFIRKVSNLFKHTDQNIAFGTCATTHTQLCDRPPQNKTNSSSIYRLQQIIHNLENKIIITLKTKNTPAQTQK
jgi:hypothetical protein